MSELKTIFIVEDDPGLVELYKILIGRNVKYAVLGVATNGEEAIEKYKGFNEKPDLILMDHRMPVKDGIETTIELLKLDSNLRILFVSADVTVREKALEIGAVGFLDKPSSMKDFLKEIEKYAENKSQ